MKIEMPRLKNTEEGGDLLTALERGEAENLIFRNQLISGEVKLSDVPGLDELVKDALGDEYDANDLVIKDLAL